MNTIIDEFLAGKLNGGSQVLGLKEGAFGVVGVLPEEMNYRNTEIITDEVIEAVYNGKIIEEYPDDYPYPSCLILGTTFNKRFLHVVTGITDAKLWIITVYEPNPDKWNNDFTMRKG